MLQDKPVARESENMGAIDLQRIGDALFRPLFGETVEGVLGKGCQQACFGMGAVVSKIFMEIIRARRRFFHQTFLSPAA